MPSNVPGLIDYLVAQFQAAPALGAASPPVTVYDGPPTTDLDAQLKLYVGLSDPDADSIQDAAAFTQSRADLGFATREELSSVFCCAEAWSGDDTISGVRRSVFAIVAAAENLVRGTTAQQAFSGLGFAAPGVNAGALQQNNGDRGAIARVPFEIQFRSFT